LARNLFFLKATAPAQSPDLNPIEMVWADLKHYVSSKMCTNLMEIQTSIGEYKASLTPQKCSAFIQHLRKVRLLFDEIIIHLAIPSVSLKLNIVFCIIAIRSCRM
jgi:hypothetical protein